MQQRERKLGKNIPGQKSSASNSEEEAIKWDTRDVEGETTRHASGCRSQGRRGLIGRRFPRSSKGSLGNEKCCKQGLLRGSFNRSPRRPRGPERFVRLDNVLPPVSSFLSTYLYQTRPIISFILLSPFTCLSFYLDLRNLCEITKYLLSLSKIVSLFLQSLIILSLSKRRKKFFVEFLNIPKLLISLCIIFKEIFIFYCAVAQRKNRLHNFSISFNAMEWIINNDIIIIFGKFIYSWSLL